MLRQIRAMQLKKVKLQAATESIGITHSVSFLLSVPVCTSSPAPGLGLVPPGEQVSITNQGEIQLI